MMVYVPPEGVIVGKSVLRKRKGKNGCGKIEGDEFENHCVDGVEDNHAFPSFFLSLIPCYFKIITSIQDGKGIVKFVNFWRIMKKLGNFL